MGDLLRNKFRHVSRTHKGNDSYVRQSQLKRNEVSVNNENIRRPFYVRAIGW